MAEGIKRPPRSEEWSRKISESKKGKPSHRKGAILSEETKQKIRDANIGNHLSNETKKKISNSLKGRPVWNSGKKLGKRPTHSLNMAGNNNPNWKGGISFELYPVDWEDNLKETIRQRDDYVCQMCGIHQKELDGYLKVLDVHHIDYNKHNLSPQNLISLCRSCHMKTNYNREKWIIYFGGKND